MINSPYKSLHAFTLIETLIVVAIIAILASMLMPALQQVREKGRQVVCMNNLKQIGMVIYLYADDYGGYIIPLHARSSYYYAQIIGKEYFGYDGSWGDRKNVPGILFCPSDKNPYQAGPPGDWFGSYGWNIYIGGKYNDLVSWPFHRFSQITDPSHTVISADSTHIFSSSVSYFDYTHHETGVNVLFIDGHVGFIKSGETGNLKFTAN